MAVGRGNAKVRPIGDLVIVRFRAAASLVADRIFRRRPQRRTSDGFFMAARIDSPQRSVFLLRANRIGCQRHLLDGPSGIAGFMLGDDVCVHVDVVVKNGEPN